MLNLYHIPKPVAAQEKILHMCQFLDRAPAGNVIEVGVFEGGSLYYLATKFPQHHFFGYDTFEGMPQSCSLDNYHKEGDFVVKDFKNIQRLFKKLKNVTLIKGLYPESDNIKPQVIMAHVDVDIYKSTKESLEHISQLIMSGGRIYCDDAYHKNCKGATIAYEEFCIKYKKPIQAPHAYVDF